MNTYTDIMDVPQTATTTYYNLVFHHATRA